MHAEHSDLEALVQIQAIDLEVMQATKKRVELPQRIEVMRLRKKRGEIQAKLDQVCELEKEANAEMTLVEDEDRSLLDKQQRAQEAIDAAGANYRKVESNSREMANIAKRREGIAERMVEITAQLDKIKAVRAQLEGAVASSEAEEARLRDSFSDEDAVLAGRINDLNQQREALVAEIDPALIALYDKTAAKTSGVALGRLDEETCGVCRTHIDGGRLIELKASAPLGVCPNCKRLLVIE